MTALPAATEALPLRCRVLVPLEVEDDGRKWHIRPQVWEGSDEVRLNEDGSVSICPRGHWMPVGAREMRWLDLASAERQAAVSGGFAALVDERRQQDREAELVRDARSELVREAVEALTELRERFGSASSLAAGVLIDTHDRAFQQFHAAEKAVDMALDRVRALTADEIPF